MDSRSGSQDFTVEIPLMEKALTGFAFAFIMAGMVIYPRQQLIEKHPSQLLLANILFALGLFGTIRFLRAFYAEKRRGVVLENEYLQVRTLLSQPRIPLEDLRGGLFIFDGKDENLAELTFLWGELRYRLPCSRWQSLSSLLVERGFNVLHNKEGSGNLKALLEKGEAGKTRRSVRPLPSLRAAVPFIMWLVAVGLLLFLSVR